MAIAKTALLITVTAMADTIMAMTTITAANSAETGVAEVWTRERSTIMNTQKQSLVRVWIPGGGYTSNTYYNDRFDLKNGDIVFVEDELNGKPLRGIVTSLIKTFKIRLSDYKKVIAQADRSVKGQLYLGGRYLLGFGKETLPYEKVITWVKPPCEEDEYIIVREEDGTSFPLDDLEKMNIPDVIHKRGEASFKSGHVKYLEVDGERARAIVDGTIAYEVEFT